MRCNGKNNNNSNNNGQDDQNYRNDTSVDKQLLDNLAHYFAFANAAYGWKGFAFCGRWRIFGGNNNRILARSTGIDRRDIVTANWHSKANRPLQTLTIRVWAFAPKKYAKRP